MSTVSVLKEVRDERRRQDEKWGPIQDIPMGTGQNNPSLWRDEVMLREARQVNDAPAEYSRASFLSVLREEFLEFATADPRDVEHLREELLQTAAVAVKAIEHIDRRKGVV